MNPLSGLPNSLEPALVHRSHQNVEGEPSISLQPLSSEKRVRFLNMSDVTDLVRQKIASSTIYNLWI